MKHSSFFCLLALVTWCVHDGVLSLAPTYGERGSDLGIQVFQQVARSKPLENVVLSPHGVASILGMLLPGAHGETRKQVLNGLRYKRNGEDSVFMRNILISGRIWGAIPYVTSMCTGPYKMLRKLHKTLTARSNQDVVLIANGMFVSEGFPMEEAFVATNKANFQCESRNLDFSAPQQAAAEINQWVNNKTRGRSHRWRMLHLCSCSCIHA